MIPGTFRNIFQTYEHLATHRKYIIRQVAETVLRYDAGYIYPISDEEANQLQIRDARRVIPQPDPIVFDHDPRV